MNGFGINAISQAPFWGQLLLLIPLGVVLVIAAYTDWRSRKIYNKLTYPAAAVFLILHGVVFGFMSMGIAFLTLLGVIILGIPMMIPRWLGAGDIKLLAVVGVALGPAPLFHIFFYSLLAGMVMGISLSLINGYLGTLLKRIGGLVKGVFLSAVTRTNVMQPIETDERAYLPFAIPILVAFALACTDLYLEWPLILETIRDFTRQFSRTG